MDPRRAPLLIPAFLGLALAACGGGSDPPPPEPATETSAAAPAADTGGAPADADGPGLAQVLAPSGGPLDVRPLAGQPEAGIQVFLGEPIACEDAGDRRTCRHARASAEVVYINGMADWIRIGDLGDAPFEAASLTRLGIGPAEPVSSDAKSIRWQDVNGFREVVMVAGADGRIDHVQLKAMTP